jgi:hypothetical protein
MRLAHLPVRRILNSRHNRFAIGLRNSHDKSFRLSCTVGLRFVCENLAFHGEYSPVLAKHSRSFSLVECILRRLSSTYVNRRMLARSAVSTGGG